MTVKAETRDSIPELGFVDPRSTSTCHVLVHDSASSEPALLHPGASGNIGGVSDRAHGWNWLLGKGQVSESERHQRVVHDVAEVEVHERDEPAAIRFFAESDVLKRQRSQITIRRRRNRDLGHTC